ncbi:MAG: TraR/DksA C4-type zinc finger protein [Chitinophagaceae bacterium]|nr:TraR/DksA C4-type zinc finger protein [Chitinophagaceae bacterium]
MATTKKKAAPATKKSTGKAKPAAKAPVKKATAKAAVKKSAPKKAVAKAAPAKKVAVKKVAVKKAVAPKKAAVKKSVPAKAVAKKVEVKKPAPKKSNPKTPVKLSTKKSEPAKKETAKATPVKKVVAEKAVEKKVAHTKSLEKESKPTHQELLKKAMEEKKAKEKKAKEAKAAKLKDFVAPKTTTDRVREYHPGKSILDEAEEKPVGPTVRYSDSDLQEFKDLIERKLDSAKKELAYLQGLITRKDQMGGDESESRYMTMEDGSLSMEREQLAQMASRQISFIDHLEKALVRIQNKTYGICRVTGKLIDKARLRAVPHATLSIEAKMGITR